MNDNDVLKEAVGLKLDEPELSAYQLAKLVGCSVAYARTIVGVLDCARSHLRKEVLGKKKTPVEADPDSIMTTTQAAKYLRISPHTLRNLDGQIEKFVINDRGDRRYYRRGLDDFLRSRRTVEEGKTEVAECDLTQAV